MRNACGKRMAPALKRCNGVRYRIRGSIKVPILRCNNKTAPKA
jgi:hypothetical protein